MAEYLDRSLTFTAAVLVLFWLVHRPHVGDAMRPYRRLLWFAVVWWVCGFASRCSYPFAPASMPVRPRSASRLRLQRFSKPESSRRSGSHVPSASALPSICFVAIYHLRNKDLVDATGVGAHDRGLKGGP
jgi:hypothetical protein